MFWRSGFHTSSAIDTILDKESFTLEEILDEDVLLQETKSQNRKLLDYLTKEDVMARLVDYVITEPAEGLSVAVRFRYPNIVCEVLTSEVQPITDALCAGQPLVERLWGYLEQENTLQPLMASFVTKVLCVLVDRKRPETLAYLQSKPGLLECILRHIETASVCDLLLRLAQINESPDGPNHDTIHWLSEQGLMMRLVDRLDRKYNADTHTNAGQLLVDIVAAREELMPVFLIEPDITPLTTDMYKPEVLNRLLDLMLVPDAPTSAATAAVSVLSGLFKRHQIRSRAPMPSQENSPEMQAVRERENELLKAVSAALVPRLGDLHKLLQLNPGYEIQLSTGPLNPPVCVLRLKLLGLLVSLLESGDEGVLLTFREHQIMSTCLDMFFVYTWNNFLHTYVTKLVAAICKHNTSPPAMDLFKSLFTDSQILDRIVSAAESSDDPMTGRRTTKGYHGHLMLMANSINAALTGENRHPAAAEITPGPEWELFVSKQLAANNSELARPLGGHRPNVQNGDSDDDFNIEGSTTAVRLELSKFICTQIGGDDLPDRFGADDDDDEMDRHVDVFHRQSGHDEKPIDEEDKTWDPFGKPPTKEEKSAYDDEWDAFGSAPAPKQGDSLDWPTESDPFGAPAAPSSADTNWDPFGDKAQTQWPTSSGGGDAWAAPTENAMRNVAGESMDSESDDDGVWANFSAMPPTTPPKEEPQA
eukprot:comp22250_c0_seq1/m.32856 comp22250_c0_seq1/g.32856  ORF comp22250_c0_seq1/g.32856 comp22250_c0_seq1/m.32856 type:complete len:704 (-) comp22250_c0_seq1:255-2366(-)